MDDKLLKNRFEELHSLSERNYCYTFSDFLSLSEQDLLYELKLSPDSFFLFGGTEGAERKISVFGREEDCGYEADVPVDCLMISPVNQKFADKLTHRDFLGALMNLGIKRETLGDIIIEENKGYIFCLRKISGFIIENLSSVKHTSVKLEKVDPSSLSASALPDISEIVVPSERLDAVIAAVYNLSRSESSRLFPQEKIFINGRITESASHSLKEKDIVSVRGKGRFIYEGIERETRRGRLRVSVRIFR
ncbi:MAG: hypothetical protein K6F09_09125 [Clostridiales bacterium]|nr:hypothetical protein [Clostridiales bacterium]